MAGSVEKRKNAFRARVYAGIDPVTKKQLYLIGPDRPTADEAEADRIRLVADAEAQRHPDRSATVATLLTRWLELADHELSTRETNEGYTRRTLIPALGDIPLRRLEKRVDILDQFIKHLGRCSKLCDGKKKLPDGTPRIDHRTDRPHDCNAKGKRQCSPHVCRPMAPATVRRINAILSSALGYAVAWGWIERNPAALAHKPKQPRRRAKPPSPDQVARLINLAWETDGEFGLFLWLAATSGARRGELTGLRWDYVDLALGHLVLEKNYIVRDGQKVLKDTKTDEPRRLSLDTLTVALLAALLEQRKATLKAAGIPFNPTSYVFTPDPAGLTPWNPDTHTHRYERLAAQLGITTPLKNLRHFSATQLLTGGIDLRTTAGRLGHADGGATTLKFYADFARPADQRAAEMLAQDLQALRDQTTLDPAPAEPAALAPYLAIAQTLRDRVTAGVLAPGAVLPTVKALAEEHGVSYGTAQRAIAELAAEGTVTVSRGRRAVVARPPPAP